MLATGLGFGSRCLLCHEGDRGAILRYVAWGGVQGNLVKLIHRCLGPWDKMVGIDSSTL